MSERKTQCAQADKTSSFTRNQSVYVLYRTEACGEGTLEGGMLACFTAYLAALAIFLEVVERAPISMEVEAS